VGVVAISFTAAFMHTSMFPFVLNFLKIFYSPCLQFSFSSYICLLKSTLQVKGAQLWGTDVYTNDSDLVAGKFLLTLPNV
jgi:hypothetical protein